MLQIKGPKYYHIGVCLDEAEEKEIWSSDTLYALQTIRKLLPHLKHGYYRETDFLSAWVTLCSSPGNERREHHLDVDAECQKWEQFKKKNNLLKATLSYKSWDDARGDIKKHLAAAPTPSNLKKSPRKAENEDDQSENDGSASTLSYPTTKTTRHQ